MTRVCSTIATLLWAATALAGVDPAPALEETSLAPALLRVQRQMLTYDLCWGAPAQTGKATGDVSEVLSLMTRSDQPGTRVSALEGISQSSAPIRIDQAFAALGDPDPAVQRVAIGALNALGADEVFEWALDTLCQSASAAPPADVDKALPYLRELLEAPAMKVLESGGESSVRQKVAAYCLGRMDSKAAVPVLAKTLWSSDPELAVVSARALLSINDSSTIEAFRSMGGHTLPEVRWAGVLGLVRLGGPQATQVLSGVALGTTETNLELRKRAVSMLGSSEEWAAVPILIEVLRSQVPLRRYAVDALRQLTGQPFGMAAAEWKAWYLANQKAGGR